MIGSSHRLYYYLREDEIFYSEVYPACVCDNVKITFNMSVNETGYARDYFAQRMGGAE
jgi:hypothetical protein